MLPGTVKGTPSPNKQPLSRPGSAGGTPGTVLRYKIDMTFLYKGKEKKKEKTRQGREQFA